MSHLRTLDPNSKMDHPTYILGVLNFAMIRLPAMMSSLTALMFCSSCITFKWYNSHHKFFFMVSYTIKNIINYLYFYIMSNPVKIRNRFFKSSLLDWIRSFGCSNWIRIRIRLRRSIQIRNFGFMSRFIMQFVVVCTVCTVQFVLRQVQGCGSGPIFL